MIINVGSKNPVKIDAVKIILDKYSDCYNDFLNYNLISVDVFSDVSEQPKSLDETINGAMNRAKNAFMNCELSVGIENGLMKVSKTKTGFMDVTVCAFFDGSNFHLGLSSAFEYPSKIIDLVIRKNIDITKAFNKAKFVDDKNLGKNNGAIGILSKNHLTRKEYNSQAVEMAVINLINNNNNKI